MESRELGCPYCESPMRPTKAACPKCGVAVEGNFKLPRVAMLPPDEAAFLAEYVLAGFSIKDLESRVGMSYPAVRARLDRIIGSMRKLSAPAAARQEILDKLESGEIRADEAVRMIEALE